MSERTPYPSDVSYEEWALVAPYLVLCREEAPQRTYPLREVLNAALYVLRTGVPWRYLPHDFPPWSPVYEQTQRWIRAGCFEALVSDARVLLRELEQRHGQPSAVILDSRTLSSTPESGARAGYDGAKRRKGSKVHAAVDTLGNVVTLSVTPANQQDRDQVATLVEQVQQVTGEQVEVAYADQGYSGEQPAAAAAAHGIRLEVIKHPEAKRGFLLLPLRWVVERDFAWMTRFRRLARDYERLATTLIGYHFLAFASLMIARLASVMIKC